MEDAPNVAQHVHARALCMSVIAGDDEEAERLQVVPKRHRVEAYEQGHVLVLLPVTEEIAQQREQVRGHVLECALSLQLSRYVLDSYRV